MAEDNKIRPVVVLDATSTMGKFSSSFYTLPPRALNVNQKRQAKPTSIYAIAFRLRQLTCRSRLSLGHERPTVWISSERRSVLLARRSTTVYKVAMINDVVLEGIAVKAWKYADDLLFHLACY